MNSIVVENLTIISLQRKKLIHFSNNFLLYLVPILGKHLQVKHLSHLT